MLYSDLKKTVTAEVNQHMNDTIIFYMMEYGQEELLDFVDIAILFQEAMEKITNKIADELEEEFQE